MALAVSGLPDGTLFGVDGHSWLTPPGFSGLSGLSPGIHWAWYAVRTRGTAHCGFPQGFFFCIAAAEQLCWRYSSASEALERAADCAAAPQTVFPAASGRAALFPALLSCVTCTLLDEVLSPPWEVTGATASYLDEPLPGLPGAAGDMRLLEIELGRTWRPGAVGREVTDGFLDKSWELERVVGTECGGGVWAACGAG
ncbi:hypothetical protein PMAC_003121 [Pneumocystis sp. 'macacae']|nr:hypothetical protein PMAC_003121 [Pneumocystis sp. 'macacae']